MYTRRTDPMYMPLVQIASGQGSLSSRSQPSSYAPSASAAASPAANLSAAFASASASRSAPDTDIVQFASPTFFAQEDDQKAVVQVLRIGKLADTCSVRYRTKDGSAEAGKKYERTEGRLDFGPGEHSRRFEVPIVDDDNFDTTIEFEVHLDSPDNCTLVPEGVLCRVMIIDDDMFPSNNFEEAIKAGSDEALHKVGFTLLLSFMKFSFIHVPSIAWKSVLMVLMAQFGNMYYLMTIFLKVYLVDVCLNIKDPSTEDRLYIHGNRSATAMLLGAAWILPNVVLSASDYFEMEVLEMGFNIRKHLRVNLFRKYLNYTSESRKEVPIQDLKTSMMEDIPDLVSSGYLILFELFRILGKIVCVGYFMLKKHPRSAVPLGVYPILMLAFLGVRYEKRLNLLSSQGEGESATMAWLLHADHAYNLITDYKQRSFVVGKFEDVLTKQRKLTMNLKRFSFWNDLLIPWITICAIGYYMGSAANQVVEGDITLGDYLAMINVYKDLGDRFEGLYSCFQSMSEAIDPLSGLTGQFNLPTEVKHRSRVQELRDAYMQEYVTSHLVPHGHFSAYDAIPISFQQVSVDYSPSLRRPVSINTPQGHVIMIRGPHDAGKSTIMDLLTDNHGNHTGSVQCPLHLRVLNVSYSPMIVNSIGLVKNLTFGTPDGVEIDYARVRRIIIRVGLDKRWFLQEFDRQVDKMAASPSGKALSKMYANSSRDTGSDGGRDSEEDDEVQDEEDEETEAWIAHLSNSERKRFHLARAFIYNPEVLVMHRPVDEMDMNLTDKILGLMREFVDDKGVETDSHNEHRRRPRTLFFTQGTMKKTTIADIIWQVGQGEGIVVERGPNLRAA